MAFLEAAALGGLRHLNRPRGKTPVSLSAQHSRFNFSSPPPFAPVSARSQHRISTSAPNRVNDTADGGSLGYLPDSVSTINYGRDGILRFADNA